MYNANLSFPVYTLTAINGPQQSLKGLQWKKKHHAQHVTLPDHLQVLLASTSRQLQVDRGGGGVTPPPLPTSRQLQHLGRPGGGVLWRPFYPTPNVPTTVPATPPPTTHSHCPARTQSMVPLFNIPIPLPSRPVPGRPMSRGNRSDVPGCTGNVPGKPVRRPRETGQTSPAAPEKSQIGPNRPGKAEKRPNRPEKCPFLGRNYGPSPSRGYSLVNDPSGLRAS